MTDISHQHEAKNMNSIDEEKHEHRALGARLEKHKIMK
jgi:hypothetical protein